MNEKTKLVLIRCARVYLATKNWDKAVSEYEVLYADFPDDPYIIEPLAKAYYEKGDRFKSKNLYEKVVAIFASKGDEIKVLRIKTDIAKMFPETPPQAQQ
ncbi:MAG: tetratricopeptide repeat protein [Candidatus Goldbacteria bacterium]|nr:tetratricopeptide repeat protein [Candidatus Goldiibacteriota bacterium]